MKNLKKIISSIFKKKKKVYYPPEYFLIKKPCIKFHDINKISKYLENKNLFFVAKYGQITLVKKIIELTNNYYEQVMFLNCSVTEIDKIFFCNNNFEPVNYITKKSLLPVPMNSIVSLNQNGKNLAIKYDPNYQPEYIDFNYIKRLFIKLLSQNKKNNKKIFVFIGDNIIDFIFKYYTITCKKNVIETYNILLEHLLKFNEYNIYFGIKIKSLFKESKILYEDKKSFNKFFNKLTEQEQNVVISGIFPNDNERFNNYLKQYFEKEKLDFDVIKRNQDYYPGYKYLYINKSNIFPFYFYLSEEEVWTFKYVRRYINDEKNIDIDLYDKLKQWKQVINVNTDNDCEELKQFSELISKCKGRLEELNTIFKI